MKRKYHQIYIRHEIKRVIKLMNYYGEKTCKRFNKREFDVYQSLGGYWDMLAEHCKHEYRLSKKFPLGKCKFCGTIKRK